MRNGRRLLLAALAFTAGGCALEEATTLTGRTARFAGETTVNVVKTSAHVVTWPVREYQRREAAAEPRLAKAHVEGGRVQTVDDVQTAQTPRKSKARAKTDDPDDVRLARATDDAEDDPGPRRASLREDQEDPDADAKSKARRTSKAHAEVDDPKPKAQRAPKADPEPEPDPKPEAKPKSRPKTAPRQASAEDDTIIIK